VSTRVKSVAVLIAEAHTRRLENHTLVCADDPMSRMLGWVDLDTGEHFEIPLTRTKETLGELSGLVQKLIQTPGGRATLFGTPVPLSSRGLEAICVATDATPSLELERPLTRSHLADVYALIERVGQQVAEVVIHPDDLAEVHKDPIFKLDSEGCLWGAKFIPDLRTGSGELFLLGDAPEGEDVATAVLRLTDAR
jgi:hypothetical protein